MTVNMIFDKTRYLALMPANKISHNNGMAQLPLAISGKPFTTMKKALFHGRLRVFGEKMNTYVYRLSHATTLVYRTYTSPVGYSEHFVLTPSGVAGTIAWSCISWEAASKSAGVAGRGLPGRQASVAAGIPFLNGTTQNFEQNRMAILSD